MSRSAGQSACVPLAAPSRGLIRVVVRRVNGSTRFTGEDSMPPFWTARPMRGASTNSAASTPATMATAVFISSLRHDAGVIVVENMPADDTHCARVRGAPRARKEPLRLPHERCSMPGALTDPLPSGRGDFKGDAMRAVTALPILGAIVVIGGGVWLYAQQQKTSTPMLSPQDYLEIQQLYGYYTRDVDPGSERDASWLFAPDGSFEGRGQKHTRRKALQEFYERI